MLTGVGTSSCGTITFLFYTAHLKVHAFIGSNGTIVKTGPVLTLSDDTTGSSKPPRARGGARLMLVRSTRPVRLQSWLGCARGPSTTTTMEHRRGWGNDDGASLWLSLAPGLGSWDLKAAPSLGAGKAAPGFRVTVRGR